MPSIKQKTGFTLVELLIVVAILAAIAAVAVSLLGGASDKAIEAVVRNDLTEIRKAIWQFRNDMGAPPHYLAELMQPPDPNDANGGWWWSEAGNPPSNMYRFDPAMGRGWNGPYLQVEFTSSADAEVRESRTVIDGTGESITSDFTAGRRLAAIIGPEQETDVLLTRSLYELDFSDPAEARLRYRGSNADPPQAENELGLGIKPPQD